MISLGWIIGNIVTVLILAGLVVGLRIAKRHEATNELADKWTDQQIIRFVLWIGTAITLVIYTATTWPTFDMQYHSYKPVSGTVQAVSSRFLGDGKSTTQNFVVTIGGHDYRCDDTRCALTKVGDTLTLSCIREWQYAGTSGWDCNFVSEEQS